MSVQHRAAELTAVADELAPLPLLTRMAERARFTISSVGLAGSTLTVLGLVSVDQLRLAGPARWLALVSAAAATASLLLALWYLQVRLREVNRRNLAEVEAWLKGEVERFGYVVLASRLLIAAVVLAAAAAGFALSDDRPTVALSVQLQGDRIVTAQVHASVSGAAPGQRFSVLLTPAGLPSGSLQPAGSAAVVPLLASQLVADRSGQASMTAELKDLSGVRAASLEVRRGQHRLAAAEASLTP